MRYRWLVSIGALAIVMTGVSRSPAPVVAQTRSPAGTSSTTTTWTPPRTPDGQVDLEGVWDFGTITPLERPSALGDKQVFTDEEAVAFEREENQRQNRDLIDPKKGGAQYPPGGVVPYNEFWYERGSRIIGSKRTSLIVDPPDGRIPLTPEGRKRVEALAAAAIDEQLGRARADSWKDRSLADRCILGFNAGPPMTPGAYNNHVQIVQTAGQVVLLTEMVHDARIIPLDGLPHVAPNVRQYKGDSRGRWEGRTLVIDTTNFLRETSFRGSSANLHLVERLTRLDADTLLYEFTVEDTKTWTRPWTAAIPMKKISGPVYEYACHEGNYAMANILSGARAEERERQAKAPVK